MEQELLYSQSRVEAPLASIQSVDVHTSFLGRLMGFGDIVVRTYTGTVLMPGVADPVRKKYLIEDYVARTKKQSRQARHDSIRGAVRESLGMEADNSAAPAATPRLPVVERGGPFSLFRTRTVKGDTIIYHKHWYTLFSNLILPAVFELAVLLGAPTLFSGLPKSSLGWGVLVAAVLAPLAVVAYRIVDWQNDVYIVTPENLIDTERKPLGSEVTKSAPIANILSLQNHKVGVLGLSLDFGAVRIRVGDSTLEFANVANPAQVQQDIFARMEALKARQERAQSDEERRRMTEWLRVYEEERGRNQAEAPTDEATLE